MRLEPGAYGQLGLSDLFEMREECLREFGFADVYRRARARAETPVGACLRQHQQRMRHGQPISLGSFSG